VGAHRGETLLGALQHVVPRIVVGDAGEIVRPRLETGLLRLRHPEHARDHGDGQRDGEAAHDLELGRRGRTVEQGGDEPAHRLLQRVDRAIGERLLDQVSESRVVGRIGPGEEVRDGRHPGLEVRGARPEGGPDTRARGGYRHVRAGEGGQDLGVARDQPHRARVVPDHGRLEQPAIRGIRIVQERGVFEVEQSDAHAGRGYQALAPD
jgi:hypothetical protein